MQCSLSAWLRLLRNDLAPHPEVLFTPPPSSASCWLLDWNSSLFPPLARWHHALLHLRSTRGSRVSCSIPCRALRLPLHVTLSPKTPISHNNLFRGLFRPTTNTRSSIVKRRCQTCRRAVFARGRRRLPLLQEHLTLLAVRRRWASNLHFFSIRLCSRFNAEIRTIILSPSFSCNVSILLNGETRLAFVLSMLSTPPRSMG